MSNNTKTKFISVLATENAKNTLNALRSEVNLTEKELLDLVVAKALIHKDEILAEAAAINEKYEAEKEAKKKLRYEEMKAAQKEVRAAARIALEDKKKKSAASTTIEG